MAAEIHKYGLLIMSMRERRESYRKIAEYLAETFDAHYDESYLRNFVWQQLNK